MDVKMFVYILYAEYSDIWKKTHIINDYFETLNKMQDENNKIQI